MRRSLTGSSWPAPIHTSSVGIWPIRNRSGIDGIRYRMYAGERGFAPVAYANLARLKQPAADLFARMQRP